jgi:hypothetical protein
MVWALTELMLKREEAPPHVRALWPSALSRAKPLAHLPPGAGYAKKSSSMLVKFAEFTKTDECKSRIKA